MAAVDAGGKWASAHGVLVAVQVGQALEGLRCDGRQRILRNPAYLQITSFMHQGNPCNPKADWAVQRN